MAYDEEFFKLYEEYLKEPRVRKNHDIVFDMFEAAQQVVTQGSLYVVDLGCGVNEFASNAHYGDYVGVDVNPSREGYYPHVQCDYTKEPLTQINLPFSPNGFVSLFSIEACLSLDDRYALYQRIFDQNPEILVGLSAGFYYKSKRNQASVEENGNITSFQSEEDIGTKTLNGVKEVRLVIETPSKMFGEDVVEVWKIFLRR